MTIYEMTPLQYEEFKRQMGTGFQAVDNGLSGLEHRIFLMNSEKGRKTAPNTADSVSSVATIREIITPTGTKFYTIETDDAKAKEALVKSGAKVSTTFVESDFRLRDSFITPSGIIPRHLFEGGNNADFASAMRNARELGAYVLTPAQMGEIASKLGYGVTEDLMANIGAYSGAKVRDKNGDVVASGKAHYNPFSGKTESYELTEVKDPRLKAELDRMGIRPEGSKKDQQQNMMDFMRNIYRQFQTDDSARFGKMFVDAAATVAEAESKKAKRAKQ